MTLGRERERERNTRDQNDARYICLIIVQVVLDGARSVTWLRRSPRSLAKDLRRSAWGDTGFRIPADDAGGCKADVSHWGHFPLCSLIRVLGLSFFRRRNEERRECTRREQLVGWQESHDHAMPCAWDDIDPGGTISEGGWARCTQAIRQAPPNCRLGGSQGCDWYGPEGSCDVRRGPLWRPPTHHPPAHVPLLVFLLPPRHARHGCFLLVFHRHAPPAQAGKPGLLQCSIWGWRS